MREVTQDQRTALRERGRRFDISEVLVNADGVTGDLLMISWERREIAVVRPDGSVGDLTLASAHSVDDD